MKASNFRFNSLIIRILVPMLILLAIQASVVILSINTAGTFNNLKNSSEQVFGGKVNNQRNHIANQFNTRWRNLNEFYEEIKRYYQSEITSDEDFLTLNNTENKKGEDYLIKSAQILQKMIKQNSATGAFLMYVDEEYKTYRKGIYIRDDDPLFNSPDYSDMTVEISPNHYEHIMANSSDYASTFDFSDYSQTNENFNFYINPIKSYRANPSSYMDWGFWSIPFFLNNKTNKVITYSMPLVTDSGILFGIMGIDLSLSYLSTFMPYKDLLRDNYGSYILCYFDNDKDKYELITHVGPYASKLFNNMEITEMFIEPNKTSFTIEVLSNKKKDTAFLHYKSIDLYNSNTKFSSTSLLLIGMAPANILYETSRSLGSTLTIATAMSIAFGIIIIIFFAFFITSPISELTKNVQKSGTTGHMDLKKTKIYEIDELTDAIEILAKDLMDSSNKLSMIIEMSGIPLVAFEIDYEKRSLYFTENISDVMGDDIKQKLYFDEFAAMIQTIRYSDKNKDISSATSSVYNFQIENEKWMEMKLVDRRDKTFGVIRDTTKEMAEKTKLEYERDYDILTDILNRRAFHSRLNHLFESKKLLLGAFIMIDLDNLKHINDQYGHDFGDDYIRSMANCLKPFVDGNHTMIGRMSGDEFYVFIYGYSTFDAIDDIIMNIKQQISLSKIDLPNKQSTKLRASAGISLYPKDSTNADELIKFADYAMYEIKMTVKGEFHYFNKNSYLKDSYMLANKEELNNLIENEMIIFHYQPIIDVKNGNVIAYEALMRPTLSTFKNPSEILAIAKAQSKLGAIERLTVRKVLESYNNFKESFKDKKLFINSISNQIIPDTDLAFIENNYGDILENIVFEFTENEQTNYEMRDKKLSIIKKWNAMCAIDDFGTGYNSEAALIDMKPDFIKIDMSLVRDINSDENKQNLISHLISYAKNRKIKTIAEGVENYYEYLTLVFLGIDLVQGFYIELPGTTPIDLSDERKKELKEIYNLRRF